MRTKICTVCSKVYEARGERFSTTKYCSMSCYGIGKRKTVERKCRNCGNSFDFKPSQLKAYPNAGRYCSRKCGYEYRTNKVAGLPIPDKYGRSGRKESIIWKEAVRAQDNSTCRRCGVYDPYIHTHHVAMRSTYPELRLDVTNGICLCASCHTWVHHHPKESVEKGWLRSRGSN